MYGADVETKVAASPTMKSCILSTMHGLDRRIADLQRSLILRERAAAAFRIIAAVIGAALVLGFLDYMLRFDDPGLRIMATAALAAAATWAVYQWWHLPQRRQWSPLLVAGRIEARFPQLRDSLSSALEFLQQSEDDRMAGSAQLRRLVVTQTETIVESLPIEEIIDRQPLRRAIGWLAISLIGVTLCLALDARAVGTALARLASPLGSTQWPRQHYLQFRDAPTRLAAGQTFEAELINKAGSLPEEVHIEYRTEQNGRREFTSELPVRTGDATLARRENVRQSFAFRAVGGDDHTMPWQWVEVIEPPQLESLDIRTFPPAYAALPPRSAARHLHVLAGTRIGVHGTSDRPIRSARILLDDAKPIVATVRADAAGNPQRAFQVEPRQWTAAKSGPYRLELADRDGVAAIVGEWNLRVDRDPPPSVSWQRPDGDLFVTSTARVPLEILVSDNLAVQRLDMIYERSGRSQPERERPQAQERIALYRGPKQPPAGSRDSRGPRGERRIVERLWDLSSLELPAGAVLTIHAEAADYRPGIGRTIVPRRISIITAEELEARLAEHQSQIVRQLERALAAQRTTRDEVRRINIRLQEAGLAAGDHNALQAAEINQRRVSRMVIDPVDGIPPLIDSLLAQIEMNQLPTASGMRTILENLSTELDGLSADSLGIAERELTAARKEIEASDIPSVEAISRLLNATGAAQADVVATLDRLVTELSGAVDYRRLARQLGELRLDQLAHQASVRAEIGLETLPLRVNELNEDQRAALRRAAAGQSALVGRFDKLEQDMDRLARESTGLDSDVAGTLADAVELSRRLAIKGRMHQTVDDLSSNRLGKALARETDIANDLQQVLRILRRDSSQPNQVAEGLRNAERQLAELRQQLAALQRQIDQAELQPQIAGAELERQQQYIRRDVERLAGQLERLQAAGASQSTQRAADHLDNRESPDSQRTTQGKQMQQAQQELERAANQLAEQRQQAEDDLARELVRRFVADLSELVDQQRQVIERTAEVEAQRDSPGPPTAQWSQSVAQLAHVERQLADKILEHSELLFGLSAVRFSLEDSKQLLDMAATLLEDQQTGPTTQGVERRALERLEGMMQAFAQTTIEVGENPRPPANAATPAGGEQPQRRPTVELFEVKMLRMLQADLNERTAAYRQRLAELSQPIDDRRQAELERESRQLAAEQGRLAKLVEEMLSRDNEE
jgi:hypothetical protein